MLDVEVFKKTENTMKRLGFSRVMTLDSYGWILIKKPHTYFSDEQALLLCKIVEEKIGV